MNVLKESRAFIILLSFLSSNEMQKYLSFFFNICQSNLPVQLVLWRIIILLVYFSNPKSVNVEYHSLHHIYINVCKCLRSFLVIIFNSMKEINASCGLIVFENDLSKIIPKLHK